MPEATLFLHCGSKEVGLDALRAVEVPETTNTFKPISHGDLVNTIHSVARETLPDLDFHKGQYGLRKGGEQMFGIHTYNHPDSDEHGLAIGFRQGLDRHMRVAGTAGAQVFCCDNMALAGDTNFLQFHRGPDIEDQVYNHFKGIMESAKSSYKATVSDMVRMKDVSVDNDRAHEVIGFLEGRKVLTPKTKRVALGDWYKPRFPQFKGRDMYSLYNCVTQGLKLAPTNDFFNLSVQAHRSIKERYLPIV